MKGAFEISRSKDKGENDWYVQKLKDKYASTTDITKKNKSVLSKKTLEQVQANPDREWQSHKPDPKNEALKNITILIRRAPKHQYLIRWNLWLAR